MLPGRRGLRRASRTVPGRALRRAFDERPEPGADAGILLALAQAEAGRGDPRALGRLEAAVQRAQAPGLRAAALAALGDVIYVSGDADRASRTSRQAIELAGADDGAERALL